MHNENNANPYVALIKSYAFPTRVKVTQAYQGSGGQILLDCKEILTRKDIPAITFQGVPCPQSWSYQNGGVFAMPSVGTELVLDFERGLLEHPFVVVFYGTGYYLPQQAVDSFVIKQGQAELRVQDDKVQVSVGSEDFHSWMQDLLDLIKNYQGCTVYTVANSDITITWDSYPYTSGTAAGIMELDPTQNFLSQIDMLRQRLYTLFAAANGSVVSFIDTRNYGNY